MNYEFWSVMIDGKFLNNNAFRNYTDNIVEAIKFESEEWCKDFMKGLRKDKHYKMVKVKCELERNVENE